MNCPQHNFYAAQVKVVNGSNQCNGKVEMYHDGAWKRVCNTEWTKKEENLVCAEMNCGVAMTEREDVHFGETLTMGGLKATCTGNETSIGQCITEEMTENCMGARVVCSSKLLTV